ncbi:uncharacterized protein TRAVEDRAFT_45208 [Trametes versicolor FP-101664 SS1]|uniref:uncharacterized protein n=1 Tax=Trametes versicolor (strain FP-101664) TaxID=717944 RepID=UPI000462187F|nr:uncharacterized protein TRAVEDRAFT_45208 [Trametes versicolor FP-101664 SS1]EIW62388.1 hypothetical protein TRAVEDRAFT_45208 [Trametes versicolor FP-101664 SS1]
MLQSSSEPPTTLSSPLVQSPVEFNTALAKQVGLSVVALRHDAELNTHSLIADEHRQSSISETVGNSGEALSNDVEESQEMAAEGGTHYSSLSGKVEQPLTGSELVPVSLIDSVSSGDRSGEAVDDSIPSALSEVAVVRHDTASETKKPPKSRARKDRAPKLADKSVHAEVSEGRMSTRRRVHAPLKAHGFDPVMTLQERAHAERLRAAREDAVVTVTAPKAPPKRKANAGGNGFVVIHYRAGAAN